MLTPDGRHARTAAAPSLLTSPLPRPDGSVIFGARINSRNQFGEPVHILAPGGKLSASFGSRGGAILASDAAADMRVLASRAPSKYVWVADQFGLLLEKHTASGSLITSLRLPLRAGAEERGSLDAQSNAQFDVTPPVAHIGQIWERADGMLWVAIRQADSRYRARARSAYVPHSEIEPEYEDFHRFYDTRVLLLDPARARVVASVVIPDFLSRFVADDLIAVKRKHPTGAPTVEIWRLSLSQKSRQRSGSPSR